jgi:hypothetical protein
MLDVNLEKLCEDIYGYARYDNSDQKNDSSHKFSQ